MTGSIVVRPRAPGLPTPPPAPRHSDYAHCPMPNPTPPTYSTPLRTSYGAPPPLSHISPFLCPAISPFGPPPTQNILGMTCGMRRLATQRRQAHNKGRCPPAVLLRLRPDPERVWICVFGGGKRGGGRRRRVARVASQGEMTNGPPDGEMGPPSPFLSQPLIIPGACQEAFLSQRGEEWSLVPAQGRATATSRRFPGLT